MNIDYGQRPSDDECFDYHRNYVALVPAGNILETLATQQQTATQLIRSIPVEQMEVVHPPYGWTIRTVLEHCCDAERVFGYRALRFSTGDSTELPGWDENYYAACGYANSMPPEALAQEFEALRRANLQLLHRLTATAFQRLGQADGRSVSVRTLAWLMAGHWLHHAAILERRLAS